MNVHYYFEETYYSLDKIELLFNQKYLNELMKNKILTSVPADKKVKFEFVGLLEYQGELYFVLPKYIDRKSSETRKKEKMKLVLKVLRKYGKLVTSTYDSRFLSSKSSYDHTSILAITDFILEDFLNHGYYSIVEKQRRMNGNGEILWDKTINELSPIISNNKPYYIDVYTYHENKNESNIVFQIHKWAVDFCYRNYGEWLGYERISIEPNLIDIDKLGSLEYLLGVLNKELHQTFIDKKINILKALKSLLEYKGSLTNDQLNIYGVRKFQSVWESVCARIFENEYAHYKDKIPKPKWYDFQEDQAFEKDTFEPDIIKTYTSENKDYFLILDAKYYDIRFTGNALEGNPSVGDVSKQLLYMKALGEEHEGKITRNYFLFPSDRRCGQTFELFGAVQLDFISLERIMLVYLSDEEVYNMFLNNFPLSLEQYDELEIAFNSRVN